MGSIWVNPDGLRVHFGTRKSGDEANFGENAAPTGSYKEIAFHVLGSDFTANVYTGPTLVLPAGVTVRELLGQVTEVFVLTGTTPSIDVGVVGSVSTNRLTRLTEAQAEALGSYDLDASAAGTLALNVPLAVQSTITVALGGAAPTITAVGRAVISVKYQDAYGD